MLLKRIDLEIKLRNKNKEYLCQPSDYSIHEGKELDELVYEIPGLSQKIENQSIFS